MKKYIHRKYGPPEVIELVEVEQPTPKENEVLVQIHAASVNAYDWHMLTADIFLVRFMGGGLLKPKNVSVGADIAGRVEAVGTAVTRFKPGDDVFGDIAPSGQSGFAEYASVPEKLLALKPANISFEEAAAVPIAGVTALQGLRDVGKIEPGQKVLVYGASGGVGTYAVQLARYFGAEVTAVCSTRNLEQAAALGAKFVIDYTKEDFSQNGQQYDLILAANGYRPLSAYQRTLTPTGRYVMAGGKFRQIFNAMLSGPRRSKPGGQTLGMVSAKTSQADLEFLAGLLESGKMISVIDRSYPFSETAAALAYLGAGHARGKVVITIFNRPTNVQPAQPPAAH